MDSTDALRLVRLRRMLASGEAKRLRVASRLSLTEAADSIGVSHPTVYRWEEGKRRAGNQAALRYLALLDLLASLVDEEVDRAAP